MELVLVALVIFLLQATNITVGSLRVMMLVRGHRLIAGGLALFEPLARFNGRQIFDADAWREATGQTG